MAARIRGIISGRLGARSSPVVGRISRPQARAAGGSGDVTGRRVAFVLHGEGATTVAGAHARLAALLAATHPCGTSEEGLTNAAGRTIYTIVLADYASCKAPTR